MTRRHVHRSGRRGFALIDAIVGGLILASSLAVIISITGRSLAVQANGEKQLVAAWLADELLSMVLVEGPVTYPRIHDTRGRFDDPFDDFSYEVIIDNRGDFEPYGVSAIVSWDGRGSKRSILVETLITQRPDGPDVMPDIREPIEPIDRDSRYYDDEEF